MEFGNFHGQKTVVLKNRFFQLECLAEAGPRVVRLIPNWTGENLFAELPNLTMPTVLGDYQVYGGHRLWLAPESIARTYNPDGHGAVCKEVQSGVRLTGVEEPATGIRKSVTVQMSSSQPFIIVKHKIENLGKFPVKLSPWAISMMRSKGVAILPQEIGNMDDDGLLPNRHFAFWPYTRWDDTRLNLGNEFITIKSDNTSNPLKIGYFNPHGWLGYVYDDVFFIKRFGVRRDEEYPDFGCNSEVYVNSLALELESLGPLIELGPRLDVVHTETWEVYDVKEIPADLFGKRPLDEILAWR